MSDKSQTMPLIGEAAYELALESARREGRSPVTRVVRWLTHTKKTKILERNCTIARQEMELEKLQTQNTELQLQNSLLLQENEALTSTTGELRETIVNLEQQLQKADQVSHEYQRLSAARVTDTKLQDVEEQVRDLEAQVSALQDSESRLKGERGELIQSVNNLKSKTAETDALRIDQDSLKEEIRKLKVEKDRCEAYSRCLLKAQARKEMCKAAPSQDLLCRLCDRELEEVTRRPSGNDADLRPFLAGAREGAVHLERLHHSLAELLEQLNEAQATVGRRDARIHELVAQVDEVSRRELRGKLGEVVACQPSFRLARALGF